MTTAVTVELLLSSSSDPSSSARQRLTLSPIWLRYVRFGPAEWVWRSLTYWKRQTMRQRLAGEQALPA
jgi:hypothetical protein